MMWLPLVVKCSSALQTQRWFLKAYIVRSKGCQGLAGWWSAPGKARAKVCMCPGQQPRPGHGGQRVRHRPLKAGQSLCLSHLILPSFFRVAFVYVRLLYYYALEFGATITVLNLCDLFQAKLSIFSWSWAVASSALNQSAEAVCVVVILLPLSRHWREFQVPQFCRFIKPSR
jgi:hypothetical protein